MKKRKCIMITGIIVFIVAAAGILCFINRDKWFQKEKPVTDVIGDGDVIEFNVERKFNLYDKNPSLEETKDIKPIKEVEVVMEGNADLTKRIFEGKISVEGFELSGDNVVYTIERDTTKSEYEYMLFAVGLDDSETEEKSQYAYQIGITKDFKVINIWVFNMFSEEDEFYWAVNEGY